MDCGFFFFTPCCSLYICSTYTLYHPSSSSPRASSAVRLTSTCTRCCPDAFSAGVPEAPEPGQGNREAEAPDAAPREYICQGGLRQAPARGHGQVTASDSVMPLCSCLSRLLLLGDSKSKPSTQPDEEDVLYCVFTSFYRLSS